MRPVPDSVEGWTSARELEYLWGLAVDLEKRGVQGELLEIGSYKGRSACALGQAGELDCVDTFCGGDAAAAVGCLTERPFGIEDFLKNVKEMGVSPKAYVGKSEDLLGLWAKEGTRRYRLIFVDGSHDYEDVKKDLRLAWELLSRGGALVADDFVGFPGVFQACIEAGFLGMHFQHVDDTKMAVALKPR